LTDQELIVDCLKGNAKSQRKLFQRFSGKMMTVCRRYACDHSEAEDILQEAFIKVFTNIAQFRFDGSLEGWIRRIVVHTALRTLQKKKVRFTGIEKEADTVASPEVDALAALSAEELLKLVGTLPDGYRIVFNLYVIEGFDHQEIGALLGINSATSRSQLAKARRALQTQIENRKRLPKKYAS
jgi:RNA polymerase sigma-70 factor (ECF subfamily)